MDLVLVAVVLVFEPLPVLEVLPELPEEVLEPEVEPVDAVVLPDVVVPVVVVVVPEVELPEVVVVVVVVPVRSTEPVAVPEDAETLVEVVDELSLELPPMEPQALKARLQARDTARNDHDCAPAQMNRLNNIHPVKAVGY